MNPYKIQNRSDSSRRVKVTKNGGSIAFVNDPQSNYTENTREAGFCLLPIDPLPILDTATTNISLSSLPMGVDGRISLYVNGELTASVRYLNKNTIQDRLDFFIAEFGNYATWTLQPDATCLFEIVAQNDYIRLVFEDDDIDYVLNQVEQTAATSNPTLIVEQYRLAIDLKNQQSQISCANATPTIAFSNISGTWEIYIDDMETPFITGKINAFMSALAQSYPGQIFGDYDGVMIMENLENIPHRFKFVSIMNTDFTLNPDETNVSFGEDGNGGFYFCLAAV